ncbi:MAG: TonB family protein [Acidobacteria bacterium]|nr:TonB family protein [Acidobacteriota bacterium]
MKAVLSILILSLSVFGQITELDRGIELYRNGNYASAIVVLEKLSKGELKNDARVWNYIGLAYMKIDDNPAAAKALERSVKLAPNDSTIRANYGFVLLLNREIGKARSNLTKAIELDSKNASAYFLRATARFWDSKYKDALSDAEQAIAVNPDFGVAYTLKADVLVAMFGENVPTGTPTAEELGLLERAIQALETCIASCTNKSQVEEQKSRLLGVNAFLRFLNEGNRILPVTNQTETDASLTPVKIISKPRPAYTDNARWNNISGTIRVIALFDVSGRVAQAFVVKSLGYGLDEQALRAARSIRFEPAKRNGVPYSVVKMVEYSFTIL